MNHRPLAALCYANLTACLPRHQQSLIPDYAVRSCAKRMGRVTRAPNNLLAFNEQLNHFRRNGITGHRMKQIDLIFRTMVAELGQRLLDATFTAEFPVQGRFVPVTVKDRKYWYFDTPGNEGRKNRRYVGPAEDPEINRRVEDFQFIKDDVKARRKLVSTLVREAGLIAPETLTGNLVEALADAGLFRLRACLVGTVAFQTYSAHLGIRLPSASVLTGDADIAQDFAISAEVGDSIPPIIEILQSIDPTFRALPHRSGFPRSTSFRNNTGYKVEFLTGNRGSDDYLDKPADMPALGGASADPLRFLDFLIYEPVRTVLLHRSGVSVIVPDPARFAVHKIIVAGRRSTETMGTFKRDKDLRQAMILFEALLETGRGDGLTAAIEEAIERGDGWRAAIRQGARHLPPKQGQIILDTFKELGFDLREAGDRKT